MSEAFQHPEHPELAVTVKPVAVRVTDSRGETLDAEIFLHADSGHHPGPETLGDRLNDPEGRFMPCRIDGEIQLLHLDRVAWVEQDDLASEAAELEEMEAGRTPAELILVTGETLRGDFLYLMPEERSRPSDALNRSTTPFLLLLTPTEATRWVHRAAIARVRFLEP